MDRIKRFLFTNTSPRQTVAKNTFWLFLSEGMSRLLKMALVIYAARVLGASGWGAFSYALSLGSLLMIFSDIGLSGLITREIVQKKEGFKTFISTALALKSVIVILSTALVVFIGPLVSHIPEARALLPLIAVTLCFDAIRDLVLYINTAFEKMERDMVVKSVMSIAIVGLGILLLSVNKTPYSIAIAYAVGSAIGCFIALAKIWSDVRELFGRADRTLWKTVLFTTLPFAAISLINNVMANTDIYLLGVWRNATEIGLYASAQRIYQFILMIPVIMATALFPLQSRLATNNSEGFADILGKATAMLFSIALPICVGGILLSHKLIIVLFGVGYSQAAPILQILLCMLVAAFPLVLFSNSVFVYNGQKRLALIYSIGMIANALFNILLIPHYGAIGSAVATLISTTTITYLTWRHLHRMTAFTVFSRLGRTVCALIGMTVVIIGMNIFTIPLSITLLIAALIYLGILHILKEPLLIELRTLLKRKSLV